MQSYASELDDLEWDEDSYQGCSLSFENSYSATSCSEVDTYVKSEANICNEFCTMRWPPDLVSNLEIRLSVAFFDAIFMPCGMAI